MDAGGASLSPQIRSPSPKSGMFGQAAHEVKVEIDFLSVERGHLGFFIFVMCVCRCVCVVEFPFFLVCVCVRCD